MPKKKNSKVVKYNNNYRSVKLNTAVIIFAIIFLYVAASLIRAWTKTPITTYKVNSSNINNNLNLTGVAIRNEIQVTSSKSGYLIYFVREGDKVRKTSPVCTVDETRTIVNALENTGDEGTGSAALTQADYITVRNTIDTYKNSYSDENFYDIYNFKGNIESKVLELSNQVMRKEVNEGGAALRATIENINSPESGIIAYYIDGYEDYTVDTIPATAFNRNEYKKTSLKTGDILDSGSTVFKLIADENWSIIAPLTREQAEILMEEKYLQFSLNSGSNELSSSDFRIEQRTDSFYVIINLNKYMIDYIDERFLNVEIILDKYDGLKIPNSSIVEKEIYKIDESFVNESESGDLYILTIVTDEEGNQETIEKKIHTYRHEDDIYYVGSSDFNDTDMITKSAGSITTPVLSLERENLSGVYLANEGVADFTEIQIIKSQDEFTIVSDSGYLKEFDNIVLDVTDVIENQTLY